ncbi:hypothetical protein SCB29_30385 [Paraburkholderia sp. SIMBA_055]
MVSINGNCALRDAEREVPTGTLTPRHMTCEPKALAIHCTSSIAFSTTNELT